MKTAIFFDFDGTLANFTGNFPQLIFNIVGKLGIPEDDRERFADELVVQFSLDKALSSKTAIQDALRALGYRVPGNLETVVEEGLQDYSREMALIPGARELLEKASNAMPLALITNGPSDMQRRAVGALGIERYFGAMVISGDEDVGVRKPNAAIFRLACERLGVKPKDVMMVGDNREADIDGALASGMQALQVGPDADLAGLYEVIAAHLEAYS
jgi:HAD superfamily hydrolase (TIGR01549 family)